MKNLVHTKTGVDPINIGGNMFELPTLQTRYVIIDDNNGVFLGTYTMADFKSKIEEEYLEDHEYISGDDMDKSFALFAKDNPFAVPRACSFETKEEAKQFISDSFGNTAGKLNLSLAPVVTGSHFPNVIELIKSNLGSTTFDMLDGLEVSGKYPH